MPTSSLARTRLAKRYNNLSIRNILDVSPTIQNFKTKLVSLDDTLIGDEVIDGEILIFNGVTKKWENKANRNPNITSSPINSVEFNLNGTIIYTSKTVVNENPINRNRSMGCWIKFDETASNIDSVIMTMFNTQKASGTNCYKLIARRFNVDQVTSISLFLNNTEIVKLTIPPELVQPKTTPMYVGFTATEPVILSLTNGTMSYRVVAKYINDENLLSASVENINTSGFFYTPAGTYIYSIGGSLESNASQFNVFKGIIYNPMVFDLYLSPAEMNSICGTTEINGTVVGFEDNLIHRFGLDNTSTYSYYIGGGEEV